MAEDPLNRLDLQSVNYRQSKLESTYTRNEGLLVIPVMGPEGTAPAIVRVHAPYGVRAADFSYQKQASPPMFPSIVDTPSGDILLGATLNMPAPITDQQQNLVYGVRGTYEYVQPLGGRTQDDPFPIDSHPFATKVDMLGEVQINITDPNVLASFGQWNEDTVDTSILTADKLIG